MLSIKGIFKDGKVTVEQEIKTSKPMQVIVTFLEDVDILAGEKFDLAKFSFTKSRSLLKNCKDSLSEAVIEERRSEF